MKPLLPLLCLAIACSDAASLPSPSPAPGDTETTDDDAPPTDELGPPPADDDVPPSSQLRRCPTEGSTGVTGDMCFLLTPTEAGLPSSGLNADVDQYALRPLQQSRGELVIYLNGSGGSPQGAIATPDVNFYNVARDSGLNVLALSYASDAIIGVICSGDDSCFLPTRLSVVTGHYVEGAATQLAGISEDEGIYARAATSLRALAELDPAGGWDAFVDTNALVAPATALRWEKIFAAGHSQGGGHAALLGKLHALARVIVLSSPCDAVDGAPASWLANADGWATDPTTRFFGLGAAIDSICPAYTDVWESLGVPSTAGRSDAMECGGAASGHGASIKCENNASIWLSELQ